MTSKPIRRSMRRPSRLRAVWLSYWTRWQLWLVMALSMIPCSIIAPSFWVGDPNSVKSAEPYAPAPEPSGSVFHHEYDQPINWSELRSLTVSHVAKCEELWIPGKAPKLESLSVLSSVTDKQLAKLCELYDLKAFTLYSPETLTAAGWKHLAGERSLHYLRLHQLQSLRDEPALEWPRNLQTLICDEPHGVSLQRLEEWQQLPLLTTLGTRLIPRDEDRLSAKEIDTLKRFPSLQRLYLVEMGKHAPNFVATQQAALPSLRVRPAHYDPVRGRRAVIILIGGLLVLVMLSIQLSTQFVTTASALTPHFTRSHVGPVVAVFVAIMSASFFLNAQAGCSDFVALTLCGASAFVLGAGAKAMNRLSGGRMPGFGNFGVALPSVVFPVMAIAFGSQLFGGEFDWFLSGRLPWLSVIVLVGSVWGAYELIAMQTGMKRRLEESGLANVPMGMFDTAGWMTWSNDVAATRAIQGKLPPRPLRLLDARYDRLLEQIQRGERPSPLAMWQLGGQTIFDMLRIMTMMLVAALIFIGIPVALFAPDLWTRFAPVVAAPAVFQLLGGGLIMPLSFAWIRRPMQAMELLRPVSRREWMTTWFQGVASEMAPTLIILIGLGALMLWAGLLPNWSVGHAALATAVIIGMTGFIFAAGMFAITLRALWQVGLLAIVGWFLVVAVIVSPIAVQHSGFQWDSPTYVIPVLIALYGVAFLTVRLAWWRWKKWEVGLVAG